MIGGHYIAYTLVDPKRMFEDGKKVIDAVRSLDLNNNGDRDVGAEEMPNLGDGAGEGKRVWCYCSE